MRPLHRLLIVFTIQWGCTFVETHDDVRAQVLLDLDGALGGEAVERPVQVRAEGHPLVIDLVDRAEAPDLEPPAVGQDRAIPAHEAVQPAHLVDNVVARPQI